MSIVGVVTVPRASALLAFFALVEAFVRARGASLLSSMSETAPVGSVMTVDPPPDPNQIMATVLLFGLLALATTLPVILLRARPGMAAVVVTVAGALSVTAFETLTLAGVIALTLSGYWLGRAGSVLLAVLLAVPFPLLAVLGAGGEQARPYTLALAGLAPLAAVAGIASRARQEARASTAARQVVAETLLEHTARGERARIARELHDVVAHHISMVAVQAETARLTTPGMPAAGAERLLAIGDTARAALTEMRRLLGVLREDADLVDRRPQPGLRELNELLDEAREASGTLTRLILRGSPVALDPGVELAAYRIVQEALTNARRHAPGAAVEVELHYGGGDLRLRIRDTGPGPAAADSGDCDTGRSAAGGGHGLSGMRERASAVGGELTTGPAPGGGFVVNARLPGSAG